MLLAQAIALNARGVAMLDSFVRTLNSCALDKSGAIPPDMKHSLFKLYAAGKECVLTAQPVLERAKPRPRRIQGTRAA